VSLLSSLFFFGVLRRKELVEIPELCVLFKWDMGLIHYNRDWLPKVKPSDFPAFEWYLEEGRRKIFASNLLTFGVSVFKRATVIKKLDLLTAMHQSGEAKDQKIFKAKLEDVLLDSLIDNIRITICFENYFKAKLLLNDILIHCIDNQKNRSLSAEQKKRPIEVKEIIAKRTVDEMSVLNDLLKNKTINYYTILKTPEYIRLLNVPPETIDFLREKNLQRNTLHLHFGEVFLIGDTIIQQYHELVTIVDRDISLLQNTLINELDPQSPSKLPVRP
jgi:hypothetical protein